MYRGKPPHFLHSNIECRLFTNSEQSKQGSHPHQADITGNPPPSHVPQPLAQLWGSLVPKAQGENWALTSRNSTLLEMATLNGWNLLMAAKDVTSTRVWGFLRSQRVP